MKYYFIILLFLSVINSNAQSKMAFKSGEWFKYKLSYSGWFKAGEATVNLIEDINNNELLHAKMIGKSTGPINLFFKVYDRYGLNCKRFECQGIIKKKIISNRSTFFCNQCQI